MKILLAIDSSAASEAVVREAASRPWPSRAIFCVLTVVDISSLEEIPVLIEDSKQRAEKLVKRAADALVTSAAAKLDRSKYEVFSEISLGAPKDAIQDFASKWQADLIFIGARGLSAVTRFLLGSVAQAVLRTAPCSVEVVRQVASNGSPSGEGMKIVLGTDGSEFSCKAVCSVGKRPWPPGSQVRIVSVPEFVGREAIAAASLSDADYSERLLDELSEVARERAGNAIAEASSILRNSGLAISETPEEMPVGDPRTTLLDEANSWAADLIVVGSHGRRGFNRLLLGSVSESVALHAHCSVEVVRQGGTHAG
jgi:nucleotide-binding universal stress UspA family protein